MLRIITDSASDLPKDYIEIQPKEFYNILDDIKRDVKTYHINPAMFTEAFLPYAQAGDSVIYLCFSTGHPKNTMVSVVGCAIGAHTGRGIVGFCFFDADDGKYAKYFDY